MFRAALDAARDRGPEVHTAGVVRSYDFLAAGTELRDALLWGLSQAEKSLPWRVLFDTHGQQLFERVAAQPEYLAARTEKNILNANIGEIVEFIGGDSQCLDLGNHASASAAFLLEHLRPSIYAPIDTSMPTLMDTLANNSQRFPWLNICGIRADYEKPLHLPRFVGVPVRCKAVLLLGLVFARYGPQDAQDLLSQVRALAGPAGRVLLTVDQTTDWQILQGAYNDQRGAMEAFHTNALRHINRELQGDFQIQRFHHRANFEPKGARIEMFLESQYAQFAHVAGQRVDFALGERIRTAMHNTYADGLFRDMAQKARLRIEKTWCDTHKLLAVHAMVAQ
ncbi:MAG: L-histidine N(alpha)-methyltransferase [Burkholderiales bacterium]